MILPRLCLALAVLPIAAAVGIACAAPDVAIDVEVRDPDGALFVDDDDISVSCESDTLSVSKLPLDGDSRFQCSTLNAVSPLGNDTVITFTVSDGAGRFADHEEAVILEPGEERSLSIQLERL